MRAPRPHAHAAVATLSATLAIGAAAALVNKGEQLSWTAIGTTGSGHANSSGSGQMAQAKYGPGLRIVPGTKDVSHMVPLRS